MADLKRHSGRNAATAAAVLALGLSGAAWSGCGGDDSGDGSSDQAQEAVNQATEKAQDKANKAVNKGQKKANQAVNEGQQKANKKVNEAQQQSGY